MRCFGDGRSLFYGISRWREFPAIQGFQNCLGPPVAPFNPFVWGEGSPNKSTTKKKVGTLILTSLLEDLVGLPREIGQCRFARSDFGEAASTPNGTCGPRNSGSSWAKMLGLKPTSARWRTFKVLLFVWKLLFGYASSRYGTRQGAP